MNLALVSMEVVAILLLVSLARKRRLKAYLAFDREYKVNSKPRK